MKEVPGFRLRVFGWSETWRVAPAETGTGWSFRVVLAPDSAPGRELPPFLRQTEWTAALLDEGLAMAKEKIRNDAEAMRKRVFIVDENAD